MYAAPEVLMGQPSNEKVRDGVCLVHSRFRARNGSECAQSHVLTCHCTPRREGVIALGVARPSVVPGLHRPVMVRQVMVECPHPNDLTTHVQADTFSYGVVLWELITKEQTERGNWRDVVVPDECPAGVEVLLKVSRLLLQCKSGAQWRSGSEHGRKQGFRAP